MIKETEEARDQRKRAFIAALKDEKCLALLKPLSGAIKDYFEGKTEAENVFKMAGYVARHGKDLQDAFKKRPDVILAGINMEENKYITEVGEINVKVRQGDLTVLFADAIINPASPDGMMAAGVAGAIKKTGGEEIEKEAVSKAPIAAGTALSTVSGALPNLYVIHAPTVDEPGGTSSPEMISRAVKAALEKAEELECETLALPGMGTGVGGVTPNNAAQAILDAIKAHMPKTVSDIILIDRGEEMVDAFIEILEKYDEENE